MTDQFYRLKYPELHGNLCDVLATDHPSVGVAAEAVLEVLAGAGLLRGTEPEMGGIPLEGDDTEGWARTRDHAAAQVAQADTYYAAWLEPDGSFARCHASTGDRGGVHLAALLALSAEHSRDATARAVHAVMAHAVEEHEPAAAPALGQYVQGMIAAAIERGHGAGQATPCHHPPSGQSWEGDDTGYLWCNACRTTLRTTDSAVEPPTETACYLEHGPAAGEWRDPGEERPPFLIAITGHGPLIVAVALYRRTGLYTYHYTRPT